MKNTYQELELQNGEVCKLTLNFARLLQIKNGRKDLYARLMKVLQAEDFDVLFDSLTILYVGYLCANLDNDEVLSEEEFMNLVPFDLATLNIIAGELVSNTKKK